MRVHRVADQVPALSDRNHGNSECQRINKSTTNSPCEAVIPPQAI
jgi:hypothetical protein